MVDTYPQPEHGWTCFHCGETFTTVGGAEDHFGFEQDGNPACRIKAGSERGLVMTIRKLEKELAKAHTELHDDNAQGLQLYREARSRFDETIKGVEQIGYDKGVSDTRRMLRERLENCGLPEECLYKAFGYMFQPELYDES